MHLFIFLLCELNGACRPKDIGKNEIRAEVTHITKIEIGIVFRVSHSVYCKGSLIWIYLEYKMNVNYHTTYVMMGFFWELVRENLRGIPKLQGKRNLRQKWLRGHTDAVLSQQPSPKIFFFAKKFYRVFLQISMNLFET